MDDESPNDDFYITLPSNARSDDQNTPSHFRVDLPRPMYLTGNWTVAAVEIQFPFSFFNVEKRRPRDEDHTRCVLNTPTQSFVFHVEPTSYTQPHMLSAAILDNVRRLRQEHHDENTYVADIDIAFDFTYNRYVFNLTSPRTA